MILECTTPHRPYLLGHNPQIGEFVLIRPDCGMWSCPHCARVRQAQWQHRVTMWMVAGQYEFPQGVWFVTLTMHERMNNSKIDFWWSVLSHAWDMLLKRMRRAIPHQPVYVQIPEFSPAEKRLHCHVLINASFDAYESTRKGSRRWRSRFFHDSARSCGLGYDYDLRPVKSAVSAGWEVSKYIGKSLDVEIPKGARRVRTSHNFPLPDVSEPLPGWDYLPIPNSRSGRSLLLMHVLRGERIIDKELGGYVDIKHPLISCDFT